MTSDGRLGECLAERDMKRYVREAEKKQGVVEWQDVEFEWTDIYRIEQISDWSYPRTRAKMSIDEQSIHEFRAYLEKIICEKNVLKKCKIRKKNMMTS